MATYLSNNIMNSIEYALKRSNAKFWNAMAYDKVIALVESELRYNALYELICDKKNEYESYLDYTNPSEDLDTTDYLDTMGKLGVATQCQLLMEDQYLTKQQMLNIEKTFCKVFGVHYNEEMGGYV